MTKIAVFDSGFGSLSIIREIRKKTKSEIIYFADQKNFPYGNKSVSSLKKIIQQSIIHLKKNFKPNIIVIGSNTPSLLLGTIIDNDSKIIGVFPPLKTAEKISKTSSIALLGTKSVVESRILTNYINKNSVKAKIIKINASPLVNLVESGQFIYEKKLCTKRSLRNAKSSSVKHAGTKPIKQEIVD